MKLIKPSFEIIEQLPGLEGIYKQIELAGRTCYKSFDKITEDSAEPFVNRMINSGHGSVLEHGAVYLDITDNITKAREIFNKNPYSKVYKNTLEADWEYPHLYISSNYRVIKENGLEYYLKYLCEPTEFHEKRITVRMICSIGTSRELNRHRASSISEMSTRYCNFSRDKFGNEVTYILPNWMDEIQLGTHNSTKILIQAGGFQEFSANNQEICEIAFMSTLAQAEVNYNTLIRLGWKPQQAREVLPLATATEVVYTAFVSDWVHFFNLRCSEAAHPSARELAIPLKEEFIKRGYIK